jgi:hypothetical protein
MATENGLQHFNEAEDRLAERMLPARIKRAVPRPLSLLARPSPELCVLPSRQGLSFRLSPSAETAEQLAGIYGPAAVRAFHGAHHSIKVAPWSM